MASKIGLHLHSARGAALSARWTAELAPTVLKVLSDDLAALGPTIAEARARGALIIGRVYEGDQSLGNHGRFLSRVQSAARAYPLVDAWEGYNEAFQTDAGSVRQRAALDLELVHAMEAIGRKAVVASYAVGNPPALEDWREYAAVIRAVAAGGHLLGLHEYSAPAMQWGAGQNQAGGLTNGQWVSIDPATRPSVDGWFTLRYRKVAARLRVEGLPVPRMVITEAGLDDVQPRPNVGARRGYKTYQGTPFWRHPVLGDFADQVGWYADRLAEDPYMVGAVLYGVGDASGKWDDFDLATDAETSDRLLAVLGQRRAPAPAPTPTEPPMADLGQMLAAEFGALYSDLRAALPRNPGGQYGDFAPRPLPGITMLAVHHTAGGKDQSWAQVAQEHISGRGWAGIGYHVGIRRGTVSYIGDVSLARACCSQQNHRVVCVVMTGNYETETVDAGDAAILRRVEAVVQRWAAGAVGRRLTVLGHKEVPGQSTACPGRNLLPLVHQLAAGGGAPAPAPAPSGPPAGDLAAVQAEVRRVHAAQGVTLNPNAALQRAIRARGWTPTTRETRVVVGGRAYIAQRGEALGGGEAAIFLCREGDWGTILRVDA